MFDSVLNTPLRLMFQDYAIKGNVLSQHMRQTIQKRTG